LWRTGGDGLTRSWGWPSNCGRRRSNRAGRNCSGSSCGRRRLGRRWCWSCAGCDGCRRSRRRRCNSRMRESRRRMSYSRRSRLRGNWRVGGSRWCRRRRQFRCRLGRFFRGGNCSCLRFCSALQLAANLLRNFQGDGTGVGLLFRNAKSGQKINDGFCLDLQLAGQFVDSDLRCVSHASLRILLFLLALRSFFLRRFSCRGVSLRGRFLCRIFRGGFALHFRGSFYAFRGLFG